MAELIVRARYESSMRDGLLCALRCTFPAWGIVMPGASLILTMLILTGNSGSNFYGLRDTGSMIAAICVCMSLSTIALMSLRALGRDSLIVDKFGLKLPSFTNLKVVRRYIPWESINKVSILGPNSGGWRQKKLLFYRQSGPPVELDLSRMKPEELEQVLLSVDIWAGHCERDPQLQDLAKSIHGGTDGVLAMSFTQMWEEELSRRFCAAVFMPLDAGQTLRNGTLKVVRPLALGGFSAIYLCQLEDNTLVVLKESVVPDDSTESVRQKALELFEREARMLMKLGHPSIVKVRDYFVENGRNYMLLDYANGQDLRQYVKQNGPVDEMLVLDWAVQVAKIMKYLHEQDPPILHRDLTPDNLVLREDGTIVLIDFGAANEFLGTATGTFVGKQAFISPEQFRGKAVVQSDLYSFGGTLYFLLTGAEPEALATSCPREKSGSISDELNEVVVSCTQMEAGDRYQSAAQLLPVLTRLAAVRGAA